MGGHRRWVILGFGLLAQTTTSLFLYGMPMLLPTVRTELQVSLPAATLVVAAPSAGLLLTLIAWGYLADRRGERIVIAAGMLSSGGCLCWAATLHSFAWLCVALVLAGACAASVNAASGRVVLGWFAPHERGLAMGVRQTAQPLGVGAGALLLPPLGQHYGLGTAIVVPGVCCVVVGLLVLVFVVDPPRPAQRTAKLDRSPYGNLALWRLHAASTLLVVPQFMISVFSLVYLVSVRHWDSSTAGRVLFAGQLAGGVGRILAGVWSDRVASRLRPMRQLAVASAVVMLPGAVTDFAGSGVIVAVLLIGAVVTVADNGLGFTAVAEMAGPFWAGRVLGAQNTAQGIAAALMPPLIGLLISNSSYGWGFAATAVFPLAAIVMTPVRAERLKPESVLALQPQQA